MSRDIFSRIALASFAGGLFTGSLIFAVIAAALMAGMIYFKSFDPGTRWHTPEMIFNVVLILAVVLSFIPALGMSWFWLVFCAASAAQIVVVVINKVISSANPFNRI